MAESLFQEANQMGIFKTENMMQGGGDYAAALDQIETQIKETNAKREAETGQIDSTTQDALKQNAAKG